MRIPKEEIICLELSEDVFKNRNAKCNNLGFYLDSFIYLLPDHEKIS